MPTNDNVLALRKSGKRKCFLESAIDQVNYSNTILMCVSLVDIFEWITCGCYEMGFRMLISVCAIFLISVYLDLNKCKKNIHPLKHQERMNIFAEQFCTCQYQFFHNYY